MAMKWNQRHPSLLFSLVLLSLLGLAVLACTSDSPSEPRQDPNPPPGGGGGEFNVTVTATPGEVLAGSENPVEVVVRVRNRTTGAPPANGSTAVVSASLGTFNAPDGPSSGPITLFNGEARLQFFAGPNPGTAVIQVEFRGDVGQALVTLRDLAAVFLSFVDPDRGQLDVGDPSRQRLGGLSEEVGRGRAEHEEVAGSLAGSLVTERLVRLLGRAGTLWAGLAAGVLFLVAPAVTTSPYAIGAAFFAGGAGLIVFNVVMVSLRQSITPDRLLGRVNSGHRVVAWGTKPLGAAAGGILGQLLGLRPVFIVMGVLAIAVLAAMTKVTDRAMDAAEREAGHL